jgi:hypothetical protein
MSGGEIRRRGVWQARRQAQQKKKEQTHRYLFRRTAKLDGNADAGGISPKDFLTAEARRRGGN